VVTDNAGNNNTMMKGIEELWKSEGIDFDHKHHHVRCLAHVMNIAIQSALSTLCCQPTNDDRNDENAPTCLKKVKKKKPQPWYS
jgi:hypothetical protein